MNSQAKGMDLDNTLENNIIVPKKLNLSGKRTEAEETFSFKCVSYLSLFIDKKHI